MSSKTLTMSEPTNPAAQVSSHALRLWNPRAVACWSLLFSPAFGAYFQMLNWQNLGEAEKAAEARTWFRMLCGLLALNLMIGAFATANGTENPVPGSIGLTLTAVWYVLSARSQVKHVAKMQGKGYIRNAWIKPVFVATAVSLAYFLLAIGLDHFLIS